MTLINTINWILWWFTPQKTERDKHKNLRFDKEEAKIQNSKENNLSIKDNIIHSLLNSKIFAGREFRAGKILNFMRGLETSCSRPLMPGSTDKEGEKELSRMDATISSKKKTVMLIDAGLAFNTPYPLLLRPERRCDVIISFDFSWRDEHDMMPFEDLLLAEKWAKLHNLPFPPIDTSVYEREGLKEMYIFKDESNPNCPVVIHFCLCNVTYRKFSKPGVPRQPGDKEGDFLIFSEDTPYATFDLVYETDEFERLHNLIKFNTILNKQKVLDTIAERVEIKRNQNDVENSVSENDNDEKRKLFAEKFGEIQAEISFSPEKVDLIR